MKRYGSYVGDVMPVDDLHKLRIPDHSDHYDPVLGTYKHGDYEALKNYNGKISNAEVEFYFRDLEAKLLTEIERSSVVVGCVAWLTNLRILEAMTKVSTLIVVQKEDFLRPDMGVSSEWKMRLRNAYDTLGTICRYGWGGLIGSLSFACDSTSERIRCVGNYNAEKKPAFPRMHNKFLIFFSKENSHCQTENEETSEDYHLCFGGASVWTGSYNLTNNATKSFENVVILRNPDIAKAYYGEFEQIWALSEPLDWESEWVAPEYRIGT